MTNRAKKITELTTLTAPAGGDFLVIEDVSANTTKKITVNNLSLALPFSNTSAQYTFTNTVIFQGLTRSELPIFQGNSIANAVFGFDIQTGALGNFEANYDASVYFYLINPSEGSNSSADFAVYANETANNKWIDMGITGSNWNGPAWTVADASDGYLYTSNSSIAVGSNTGNVYLFAGGTLASDRKAVVAPNGIHVISNLTINSVFTAPQTTKTGTSPGGPGEICWDDSYIYVCTSANTWKRAALSTF
jgi:hypothetical protein